MENEHQAQSPAEVEAETRALRLSVVLYAFVFVLKLGAYFHSGVMALLAEGLHTLSDVFVSGFLLLAARWSRKKPDQVHMFGYGRAQYVGALVAAVLFISFTCLELCREAIPRIVSHGPENHQNLPVAMGVLVASMAIAAAPLVSLLRAKKKGAAAKAQLMELVNDQLGLLAALVGTALVLAGFPLADPIASLVVAAIIGTNGIGLFRENLSFLVGRAPDAAVLVRIEEAARSIEAVKDVHELRAQYLGPDAIYAVLHIRIPRGTPIEDADEIAKEVSKRIRAATAVTDVTVHVDPERAVVAAA
jgi:cation diffusion facilitator family transporter